MRLPVSSGGNPQNNTGGLGSGERPARLTPERLVRNEGHVTTRANQSTFGGDPRSVGHVWGNVGRAADKVLGVLERENARQRTRDANIRNATNLANFSAWSTERLRINSKRSGLGFKGMALEDQQSFEETFLAPQILAELSDEDREHYELVARQYMHDHLNVAIRAEDAGLDAAELTAYKDAEDAILQDLKVRPGDKVAFSHAEQGMNEILTAKWLKENEGQELTKDAEDAIRRDAIEKIGTALRTQVEDAVAREEYELAEQILDGNDRIYFGDDYNELRSGLESASTVQFGLRMAEENDDLEELGSHPDYQNASLRKRDEARRAVLSPHRGLAKEMIRDKEFSTLVDATIRIHGPDTIAAADWLRVYHGLNEHDVNVVLEGVDKVLADTDKRVARQDTFATHSGNGVHKILNGERPNLQEYHHMPDSEAFAAEQLRRDEGRTDNSMPGSANNQYKWVMSTSLSRLKNMSAQEFYSATLYLTDTDRATANHRYKAARWSRTEDIGQYTPADYAKIEVAARDAALAEGLSEKSKNFGLYKNAMVDELKVALEQYSGIDISPELVQRAAREIVSRIPDFATSSQLGGLDPDDDWTDLRNDFDGDLATPDQVYQAEQFFPEHLRRRVNPNQLERVMAAFKIMAADFHRPDIKQQAMAEILLVRDDLQYAANAEYLDFLEGSNEPGYRGGAR